MVAGAGKLRADPDSGVATRALRRAQQGGLVAWVSRSGSVPVSPKTESATSRLAAAASAAIAGQGTRQTAARSKPAISVRRNVRMAIFRGTNLSGMPSRGGAAGRHDLANMLTRRIRVVRACHPGCFDYLARLKCSATSLGESARS